MWTIWGILRQIFWGWKPLRKKKPDEKEWLPCHGLPSWWAMQQGKYLEAIELLLWKEPDRSLGVPETSIAFCYYKLKEYEKAEEYALDGLLLSKTMRGPYPESRLLYAAVLLAQGKNKQAKHHFVQCITKDIYNRWVYPGGEPRKLLSPFLYHKKIKHAEYHYEQCVKEHVAPDDFSNIHNQWITQKLVDLVLAGLGLDLSSFDVPDTESPDMSLESTEPSIDETEALEILKQQEIKRHEEAGTKDDLDRPLKLFGYKSLISGHWQFTPYRKQAEEVVEGRTEIREFTLMDAFDQHNRDARSIGGEGCTLDEFLKYIKDESEELWIQFIRKKAFHD